MYSWLFLLTSQWKFKEVSEPSQTPSVISSPGKRTLKEALQTILAKVATKISPPAYWSEVTEPDVALAIIFTIIAQGKVQRGCSTNKKAAPMNKVSNAYNSS